MTPFRNVLPLFAKLENQKINTQQNYKKPLFINKTKTNLVENVAILNHHYRHHHYYRSNLSCRTTTTTVATAIIVFNISRKTLLKSRRHHRQPVYGKPSALRSSTVIIVTASHFIYTPQPCTKPQPLLICLQT